MRSALISITSTEGSSTVRLRALTIGSETINSIRRADSFDWSQVEPSVFGTMFERVFNPKKTFPVGNALHISPKISRC